MREGARNYRELDLLHWQEVEATGNLRNEYSDCQNGVSRNTFRYNGDDFGGANLSADDFIKVLNERAAAGDGLRIASSSIEAIEASKDGHMVIAGSLAKEISSTAKNGHVAEVQPVDGHTDAVPKWGIPENTTQTPYLWNRSLNPYRNSSNKSADAVFGKTQPTYWILDKPKQ